MNDFKRLQQSNSYVPLTSLTNGQVARVARLDGGEGFRHKVIALGILPGSTVRMQSYGKRGPIVITVNDTRVAVGRQLAERIYVDATGVHMDHG